MLKLLTDNNLKGNRAAKFYHRTFGSTDYNSPSLKREYTGPKLGLTDPPEIVQANALMDEMEGTGTEPQIGLVAPKTKKEIRQENRAAKKEAKLVAEVPSAAEEILYEAPVDNQGNSPQLGAHLLEPINPEEEKKNLIKAQKLQALSQGLESLGRIFTLNQDSENFIPAPTEGIDFASRIANLDQGYRDDVQAYNNQMLDFQRFNMNLDDREAYREFQERQAKAKQEAGIDYLTKQDELMTGRQAKAHDRSKELIRYKAKHDAALKRDGDKAGAKEKVIAAQQKFVNGLISRLEDVNVSMSEVDDDAELEELKTLRSKLLSDIEVEEEKLKGYLDQQAGREHFKQPEPEPEPSMERGEFDIYSQMYRRTRGHEQVRTPKGTFTINDLLNSGVTPEQIDQYLQRQGGGN